MFSDVDARLQSHFDLTPIPISEDPDCSFDICVYYLQNQNNSIDRGHDPDAVLDLSCDSDLFQAFDTSLTLLEPGHSLDRVVDDPRQYHPGMTWSLEMVGLSLHHTSFFSRSDFRLQLQHEGPLSKLMRLTHTEVISRFAHR